VVSVVILPTAGGQATELATPDVRESASWSSDGRRLLFASRNSPGEIYSMPVEGGPPHLMGNLMGAGVGLSVDLLSASPDGTQIVFTDAQWDNRLWVLKNAFKKITTAR
jgi:Tol biopolymer transport system component